MAELFDFDVVIIGAGPGGYVAAIRAAQLKMSVALVEKDKPGGVCLNVGCIPSKSLIHQAELFQSASALEKMGVKIDRNGFDFAKVHAQSRRTAEMLSKGVAYLLKKNGVTVLSGTGVLTGPHEVRVDEEKTVTGRAVIIATGSRPREIPGFPFDESVVLSSTGAVMLDVLPEKIMILGGGAIGIEFAYILNSFGVQVHLVEMLDRILPLEDDEVTEVLRKSLVKKGVTISTGTKAVSLSKKTDGAEVMLEDTAGTSQTVAVDKVLVVVGRIPNTDSIGIEHCGIATDKGTISVDEYGRTSVESVYAIGDVVGTPQLAHVASKEAEIAVEHIVGHSPKPLDQTAIPGAIYSEPQIAGFGLTERQAKEQEIPYEKTVFPYRGAGKSVAIGATEGMVKLLTAPETQEILGAHIVGAQATELIHELLLAKSAELLPSDIAEMIHAHPTLSEALMETARGVDGWAIHI